MNEYRKNVTIVLNFLKGRGYVQSKVKNHERFYTLLADDLAAKDITYSPEYGKALLSTLPVPAWLPKSRIENAACISKLDDAYIHGCIINAQGIDLNVMLPYLRGHKSSNEAFYYYHQVKETFRIIREKDSLAYEIFPEVRVR